MALKVKPLFFPTKDDILCSISATGRYLVQPPFLFSKWKEKSTKNGLKASVCALLNSNGGKFQLKIDDDAVKGFNNNKADQLIRSTEQYLQTFLDPFTISNNLMVCDRTSNEIIMFEVKGIASLCTLEYNIYLPTDAQVLPVKNEEMVKKIVDVSRLVDVTETQANVPTTFVQGRPIGFMESKTARFKLLKAEKSKGKELGDRIISHDLTHYVSAFANYHGGRIYYGVDDDGIVRGTEITEKDKQDLTKKLNKYLNTADEQDQADTSTVDRSMQWPDNIRSKKGTQWDILFKPVEGDDGEEIPSTYVIVIFVAPCPGGVFAKEPESYFIFDENVDGSRVARVQRMTMAEWKRRLLYPTQEKLRISRMSSRRDWSSFEEKLSCDALDGDLLRLINLGRWDDFKRVADEQDMLNRARGETADVQIDMVLLSKWFVYHYRKDEFDKSEDLLRKFESLVPESENEQIFHVRGRLILSEMERTRGNHKESYKIAKEILCDVEQISACILTAEFYVHFATVLTIIEAKKELNDELKKDLRENVSFKEEAIKFYDVTLQHLREAEYVPRSKADMEQKTYINLAILKLGCSLSGDVVDHHVGVEDIEAASVCLEHVDNLITKKRYGLSGFRKCHHFFALSSLLYRQSQLETTTDLSIESLESAIEYAEDAKGSAERHDFHELLRYSEKHALVYKNELKLKISEKRKHLKRKLFDRY